MAIVAIGLFMKKSASKNINSYLLANNKLPWYILGLSSASCMFDISGTMWLVSLTFVYGLKSIWIPWLWPVFSQIFFMVFLSSWIRRSNVKTGGEWITTRFGSGKDGQRAHTTVVIFAILSCIGFLAYGFIGIGKFIQIFLPWDYISPYMPFNLSVEYVPHFYATIFTIFAVFFTVLGGMAGIVWADVIQFIIMTVSSVIIGLIAMDALASHQMNVPEAWHSPFFGWQLNMDWSGIINDVNRKINKDGFSLFSIFFMMMLFKGILMSLAGPASNSDVQKILSTKSPKEAAKMSGFVSVVLMPVKYFMIAGIAVLAIIYYKQLNLLVAGQIDFEQIFPSTINKFVPVGFTGILLAGLLASFMSTFASTLNTAQAYIMNDVYLRHINPLASNKKISTLNYSTGIIIVLVSIVIGCFTPNINSIMQWIVSALYGSYVASNLLKWYWWRFNGSGYLWGMIAGIIPALVFPFIFPDTLPLYYFALLLLVSLAGCIVGTYLHPQTNDETLKSFYTTVRPWGFWGPIYDKMKNENPMLSKNYSFGTDMFNVGIGIIAQTALVLIPIFLVLMDKSSLIFSLSILMICTFILKKTWWNKLEKSELGYVI
jgi:solute:Na+ symporter, SSS family